jgi:transcription antitermination factor NusG
MASTNKVFVSPGVYTSERDLTFVAQSVGVTTLGIVGETIKIVDGPFTEFVGDIQEINEDKKKLKVIVKIFGRGTEVELNFMQVEKTS